MHACLILLLAYLLWDSVCERTSRLADSRSLDGLRMRASPSGDLIARLCIEPCGPSAVPVVGPLVLVRTVLGNSFKRMIRGLILIHCFEEIAVMFTCCADVSLFATMCGVICRVCVVRASWIGHVEIDSCYTAGCLLLWAK